MKTSCIEVISFLGFTTFLLSLQTTSAFLFDTRVLPKIVGGDPASEGQWPFFASIAIFNPQVNETQLCGGTLVASQWVLTARYCAENVQVLFILFGVHNISNPFDTNVTLSILDTTFGDGGVKVHYCDSTGFLGVDFALLKLAQPIQNITPACLPVNYVSEWNAIQRGSVLQDCIALGFGRTDTGRGADILQQVSFRNTSQTQCSVYDNLISDTKICAGGIDDDTCGGDEGGPILCPSSFEECGGYYLAGVTIAGSENCGSGTPGVYEAVYPSMYWITNVLQERSDSESLMVCQNRLLKGLSNSNSTTTESTLASNASV